MNTLRAITPLVFVSTLCSSIILQAADTGSPGETLDGTKWLLADIEQRGIADGVRSTLEFSEDNRVSGRGGCNRFFCGYERRSKTIAFGAMGTTKMACPLPQMEQEARYMSALQRVNRFEWDREKKILKLFGDEEAPLLTFSELEEQDEK